LNYFKCTIICLSWLVNLGLVGNQQALASQHSVNQPEIFILNSAVPPSKNNQSAHSLDLFIEQVFSELNIKLEYRNTPSIRTFRETNSGFVDGSYPHISSASLHYKNLIKVPQSLGLHELVAVTTNPNINLSQGLAGLNHYKIGYIAGWILIEPLINDFKNTYAIANKKLLFNMLQAGRLDIILYGRGISQEHVNVDLTGTLRILEPTLRADPLHIFLHKKHRAILPLVSEKIRKLRNGRRVKY